MSQTAQTRLAQADDVEAIGKLLAKGFPPVPLSFWRMKLSYPWLSAAEKPDLGSVVVAAGEIVGFLGAMYSSRLINGQTENFCNLFSWYIEPGYRRFAVPHLLSLVRRTGYTFTNVTPADHVIPIFKQVGFKLAEEQRFIFTPSFGTFFPAKPKVRVLQHNEVTESVLDPENWRIYQDHFGLSVQRIIVSSGSDVCLIITKRMHWGQLRFPRTELYYVSNREFFARHFNQVLLLLLRRDKTVALHVDPRQMEAPARKAKTIAATAVYPSAMLVHSKSVPIAAVDRLYTELVIDP
jgi:hypothetical protein